MRYFVFVTALFALALVGYAASNLTSHPDPGAYQINGI